MRVTRRRSGAAGHDRGTVDVSIEMLFGMVIVLLVVLSLVESVAYWHARNVFDEAAAEGARVAAAFDGSCAQGVAVARATMVRVGRSWATDAAVTCTEGVVVVVTVRGRTPGVLGGLGISASVSESAPKER